MSKAERFAYQTRNAIIWKSKLSGVKTRQLMDDYGISNHRVHQITHKVDRELDRFFRNGSIRNKESYELFSVLDNVWVIDEYIEDPVTGAPSGERQISVQMDGCAPRVLKVGNQSDLDFKKYFGKSA